MLEVEVVSGWVVVVVDVKTVLGRVVGTDLDFVVVKVDVLEVGTVVSGVIDVEVSGGEVVMVDGKCVVLSKVGVELALTKGNIIRIR